jgi:hypothetical protein
MKAVLARLILVLSASLALGNAQAAWTVQRWSYAPEMAPLLTLTGMSSDSCIPEQASVARADRVITVHLGQPHPLCFSAFRGWSMPVDLRGVPSGRYRVDVTAGGTTAVVLATFDIDVVFGIATPETVPATSPALLALLAVLLGLSAAWTQRRRGAQPPAIAG